MLAYVLAGIRELRSRPSHQIAGLDALRALAVLLVVLDHFRAKVWLPTGGSATHGIASTPLALYGWTGVDLFFVLSGFLIGQQIWRERDRTGQLRVGRFLLRRGLRIWPLYFATIAALWLGLGEYHPRWPDWLLLSNYFTTPYARSWSLSTEEHFYLAAPLFLLLTRRWPLRRYLLALPAVLGATIGARYVTAGRLASRGLDLRTIDERMYGPFHLHNEGLLVGLLIALVVTLYPAVLKPSSRPGWSTRGTMIALGMAAIGLALHQVSQLLFAYTALALIFGGALVFVLVDRSRLSAISRLWLWYPISRLSYGMYLNHLVFAMAPTVAVVGWCREVGAPENVTFVIGALTAITVSLVLSIVTFLLIERPFLGLRDRLLARRPAAAGAPSAIGVATS